MKSKKQFIAALLGAIALFGGIHLGIHLFSDSDRDERIGVLERQVSQLAVLMEAQNKTATTLADTQKQLAQNQTGLAEASQNNSAAIKGHDSAMRSMLEMIQRTDKNLRGATGIEARLQ